MRSLAINQLLAVMLRPIPNVSFNFPITILLVIDHGKSNRMFHVPFLQQIWYNNNKKKNDEHEYKFGRNVPPWTNLHISTK